MEDIDLLVHNGHVVTMDPDLRVIPGGSVAVHGGRIVEVGELPGPPKSAQVVDAAGNLVIPGLVNGHTHAAMTIFRGLADDLPLMEWLTKYIFPAEARYVNPQFVHWGVLLACAEMIRSGTTTFCDMYFFEEEAARAVKSAGVRAVLGEALVDVPTPNVKTPADGLVYTEDFLKRWTRDPIIRPSVAPHSPYACSPELLKEAFELAERYNVPYQIHVSETEDEVAQCGERYGRTPPEHLDDLGVMGPRTLAAHGVHLAQSDIELIARRGAGVVHCAESNMKLAAGIAPVPELMAADVAVGLGTDGCASNNDLCMFEEMDVTAKLHKVHEMDPSVMSARDVCLMATREGARVLGLGEETGSLEPGKRADIVIIDMNRPHLVPMYDVYSHLVYAVEGDDVDTVIVEGRVLMESKALLTIDEQRVMDEVRSIAARIGKSRPR